MAWVRFEVDVTRDYGWAVGKDVNAIAERVLAALGDADLDVGIALTREAL